MATPFMNEEKLPSFLPRTSLATAPSQSFLHQFDANFQKKSRDNKKPKANINVYDKSKSKESCEDSIDQLIEYDYVKFYVDFKEVYTLGEESLYPTQIFKKYREIYQYREMYRYIPI